ncbi:MAG: hypothetical protein WCK76_09460, partial [Elusimicrobiota bacterium]
DQRDQSGCQGEAGRAELLEDLRNSGTKVFAVESDSDTTVSPTAVTGFMGSLPYLAENVYIRYPVEEGIRHAAVTRPETNPHFAELSAKLKEFAARD